MFEFRSFLLRASGQAVAPTCRGACSGGGVVRGEALHSASPGDLRRKKEPASSLFTTL